MSHDTTNMPNPINARCTAHGATFLRGEVTTETKGELACPACGANDVRTVEDPERCG